MNKLYYGDCLSVMQSIPLGAVDLVYLDPPFNSNRDYCAIYRDETGCPLPDQIEAFNDLWTLDEERIRAIKTMPVLMRDAGIRDDVAEFWRIWMNALRSSNPRMLAYLSYMTERLLPLRGIVKPTGTIYLHCDPTASHYIKVMMDGIFGHENFRNEIIWCYSGGGIPKKDFPRKHDVILRYTRGKMYTFNPVYRPYSEGTLQRGRTKVKGKYFDKGFREEGTPVNDWWPDVKKITSPTDPEKLGYATQKSVALMERIISTSSNKGDLVLDPFCGCASTIEAAHNLKRKWIGIDIAIHAIKRVAKVRLEDRLGLREGKDFAIEGVPHNVEGAKDLWERDKFHFQKWAIEQVDGFVTTRKTGDGGIDGRLYFSLPNEHDLRSMLLEVKGGKNVDVSVIRDLRGVLEREQAAMAGLIVMDNLGDRKSANFHREMAEAGDLNVSGVNYSRMQMLTVQEILSGKRFMTPSVARGRTIAQPLLPFG